MRSRLLLAALAGLRAALRTQAEAFSSIVKVGCTHLQDATPVTFGQEFGGNAAQFALAEAAIHQALPDVHALAIGGTAAGTGLRAECKTARDAEWGRFDRWDYASPCTEASASSMPARKPLYR